MTFCLGIRCEEGLVAIADTRITSGSEVSMGRKTFVYHGLDSAIFVMTSGLRSVRDKVLAYFDDHLLGLDAQSVPYVESYRVAGALGSQIRRVYEEDSDWLMKAGLQFDLHCILGCQVAGDEEPHLYLVYPQGNWVEVTTGTPYVIIGDTRYGKPILDRTLRYEATLEEALRVSLLAFESTTGSTTDVGPPVDALAYARDSFRIRERRLSGAELQPIADCWQQSMERAVEAAADPVSALAASLVLGEDR